ncbi:MAG TPA: hypothetical protein VGN57_08310 [Pirellulaceae bacterium]|jgi:hypothetical protein|nr:hypothetical protein [Pirellulaceae bacterium]
MEARRRLRYRLLQWSFVACVAAALWTAGFYGGRSIGRERAYADGLVPAAEGIARGRADAVQWIIDRSMFVRPSTEAYDVRAIVAKRLGRKPTELTDLDEVNEQMVELAEEIYRDVAPEKEASSDDAPFVLRGYPTNQMFIVKANGRRHAELTVYLKSKEEYLAWKAASPSR